MAISRDPRHVYRLNYEFICLAKYFFQGRPTFLRDLISHLPTKTEEEIREHEDWFQEYLNLNDIRKEAIQKWKEKKEVRVYYLSIFKPASQWILKFFGYPTTKCVGPSSQGFFFRTTMLAALGDGSGFF